MKEMSMPELGQGMDTTAAETAELELAIQQQLDAITLDDQDEDAEDEEFKAPDVEEPGEMLDSMQTYLDVLKTQTLRFEEELQECDEILVDIETARTARDKTSSEEQLLFDVASELGEDPSTLKDRVLAELEEEELKDKSHVADNQPTADDQPDSTGEAKEDTMTATGAEPAAEEHADPRDAVAESSISVETAGVSAESESVQLETEDQSTAGVVEESVTEQNVTSKTSEDVSEATSDCAVTTEGPSEDITLNPGEGVVAVVLDTDLLERQIQEELKKLDEKFDKREEKRKQGLASLQELEEREEEKRNERRKQIQEEEQKLALFHQEREKKLQEEVDKAQKQMEESAKIFEAELQELSEQNRKDQEDLRRQQEEQKQQQQERRNKAALKIQTTYRGYRARKEHGPVLTEKIVERKRKLEEARIQNIEQERQREADEKHAAEERERQRKEDEKKKKLEEENKKKAEEKRLKEEAEKKKQEEARRLKEEEEKKRKEEERKQKEEAEKKKREEEKRQREEAERKRKEEEKRLKEEAERKQQEQEAERKRKEEEREAERKRGEEKRKEDEEKKKKEEQERKMKEGQQTADSDGKDTDESIQITKELEKENTRTKEEQNNGNVSKNMKEENKEGTEDKAKTSTEQLSNKVSSSQVAPPEGTAAINTKQDGTTRTLSKHIRKPQPAKHEDLGKDIERRRLAWMKNCTPWSKVSHEVKVNKKPGRRAPRRPSSAKKLPSLTDQQILSAAGVSALQQVKTVQLEDLPGNGHNISSLGQCPQLRALSITNSPLGFVDDLQTCKNLKYIKLVNTKIEMVNLKDLPNLFYVDLSNNSLSSIHGFEGCENLRHLNLSHNKITRIGGLDGLKKLHTLNMSHNQLITSRGVGEASALQVLDLSHNHLPIVDDIDKLCLLQYLTASSNNLLEVPKLSNHVLLSHLVLDDNSISFIDSLSSMWLPLLETISLNNNSITQLTDLRHLLLLKSFQLAHNQILDTEEVSRALAECCSLENLSFSGNPLADEPNYRVEVLSVLPQLHYLDGDAVCAGREDGERSRPQYASTYLSQLSQQQKLLQAYHKALEKHKISGNLDLQKLYHIHLSYLDKSHKMAVEHRYAHEYGDSDAGSAASSSMDFTITVATSQDFGGGTKPSQEDYKKTTQSMKNMFDAAVSKAQSEVAVNQASVHKRLEDQNISSSNGGPLVPVPPTSPPRVRSATRKVNMHLGQSSPQGSANQLIKAEDQEGPSNTNTYSEANMNMQMSNVNAKVVGKLLQAEKDSDPTLIRRKESAVRIQAAWRGYLVRRDIDNRAQELFNSAAVMIQSAWRGYWVRKRLQVAKQFMKFDDDDDFGYDEINMDDFVFNEADFENGMVPPKTPQIPSSHPVLGQPLGGQVMTNKPSPLLLYQHPEQPPGPRQAWRNPESPLINTNGQLLGKPPVPPGSRMSSLDTHRTKKSEQLSEEWGFKDSHTAELMMQRARKMKYNAQRKQKMSKLDPKQRLALLRKLEQSTKIRMVRPVARRHLPRKEYFQARAQEEQEKEIERVHENQEKAQRTFEWLHTQVIHDPDANLDRAKRVSGSDSSLPQMDPNIIAGARMQLTGSPASMELQSVESVSLHGDTRRLSLIERPGEKVQLPPIKTSSAPTNKVKERLSWRNPEVNRSGGWGGGKKRSKAK